MAGQLPHERPGLFRRKWQLAGEPVHPVRVPWTTPTPDRVLFRRPVETLEELVAMSNGAKLALGVTKDFPAGQLGPGWTWWARHGAGADGVTGRLTESLYLRIDRAPRSALFLWSRPIPSPALAVLLFQLRPPAELDWPVASALLDQLPALDWSSEYVTAWTTTATGRPEDIPRVTPSAVVKKEIRS